MPISTAEHRKVFVSYSHNDVEWLKRLQIHLKDLERSGLVELWDDTKIQAGAQWHSEIRTALKSASVAILLVSADFIASDFIANNELPLLLKAAEQEGVVILPLILSPSRFEKIESLSKFQSVNPPWAPLINLSRGEQERYLVKLSDDVLRAVEKTKSPSVETQPETERQNTHSSFEKSLSNNKDINSIGKKLRQALRSAIKMEKDKTKILSLTILIALVILIVVLSKFSYLLWDTKQAPFYVG